MESSTRNALGCIVVCVAGVLSYLYHFNEALFLAAYGIHMICSSMNIKPPK